MLDLTTKPTKVRGIDDEDALMAMCPCGGWRLRSNEVAPVTGRWHDRLGVTCDRCGQPRMFVFDITSFFASRPGVWMPSSRFRAQP